ncbi:MAG: hypothetical protein WBZ29_03285 [Methanocella sp.]
MLQALWNCIVIIAKVYFFLMVLCVLGFVFILFTSVGDHAMVNDTIRLTPGDARSYTLPPGMTWIHIEADAPIEVRSESLTGHSMSNGTMSIGPMSGSEGMGSIVPISYGISNLGSVDANVSLRISTGMFNPFAYIL